MKPKLGFLGVLALVAALGLLAVMVKRSFKPSTRVVETEQTSSESAPNPQRPAGGSLLSLRKMISAPIRGASTEMARVSPECRELETTLLELELKEIDFEGKLERLPNPSGCSPSDPRVSKILRFYATQCATAFTAVPARTLSKAAWEEKFSGCQSAIVMTRSTLASLTRGQRPLSEITDMRELADELVAGFGEMVTAMSPEGLARLKAAADRMVELDPNLFPAVKSGAMAAMLEAAMAKEARDKNGEPAAAPDWQAFEDRVARLEALNPQDPDLDMFQRMVKTLGMNPALVQADSRARLQKAPDNWHEHEVYAWASWRLGKTGEARAALREAIRLNPKDPELQANWKIIQKPGATRDDFKIQMKAGVGLTELLR